MDYNLKFKVKCSSLKEAQQLYDVLVSEKNTERDRSSFSVSRTGAKKDSITFDLSADDATALRASLNAITANLQIFEKSRKL